MTSTKQLVETVKAEDKYDAKRKEFFEQSYEYDDGKSTERLLKLILEDNNDN